MEALGGTRARRRPRWMIPSIAAGTLVLLVVLGLFVIYPRVGAWMIRDKAGAKLTAKLGREIRFGSIDVSLGHAVIHDLEVRGPLDGDTPLVHVDRIDLDFDTVSSLVGSVHVGAAKLDGVVVTIRRYADGRDNLRDVIDHLRTDRAKDGAGDDKPSSGMLPTSITVTHGRLFANDGETGATMLVNDGEATWKPGELIAVARSVTATTIGALKASATKFEIRKLAGQPPVVTVEGGELSLWPRLSLTGIGGKVAADPTKPDLYAIDMAGGYGGVPGNLWTAKGGLDPRAIVASIDLEADKFQLDRLAPILARTPVVDYKSTSIDTKVHLELDRLGAKFAGEFHLRGLNVGHPMIADKEVRDLDLSGKIAGSFDRSKRQLELVQGDFIARDMPFSVTGLVARAPKLEPGAAPAPVVDPTLPADEQPAQQGPGGVQLVNLRVVIPPIDCQRVLTAIPTEMAPYMEGYKLRGMFDADVRLDIDWADLDATKLDGHIGLAHCKVLQEPADSPKRLKTEFEHYVEVDEGQWDSFIVGPTNEDFVPFEDISPFLIKSIMSTEDSSFYFHHGFITTEFRSALVNNLKKGRFVQGASSITMQMVKNVLLYREKTLSRKLQELFLTWHVENTLTKDRILEIYFNVIEYGPGLYGIGPATRHFFGKEPKDLNPVEAAFFSTILPSPKARYMQYCAGTLTKWTTDKIQRILGIMLKRDRLTQLEYDQAMATPLVFAKDGTETEQDCLKRVKKAIKNARPTNPLKK
ncbi:MAG: glycosyl transferase family 51 [Deltaproteobacteria bacterium]|nr:glycosyl transferase family 51 [Deltaproteobacteria bacterium]